jgi:uncharacterized membrane protein
MDMVSLTVGLSLIFAGGVIALVSMPLLYDKVSRNIWYGVRIPKSMESDANWYEINRYGAKQMIPWAFVIVCFGVVALMVPLQPRPALAIVFGFAPLIFLLIPIIKTMRWANRLDS